MQRQSPTSPGASGNMENERDCAVLFVRAVFNVIKLVKVIEEAK